MISTQVDIDAAVLDAARRFFPRTAAGLDDPRTTVVVGDGAAYAAAAAARGERYDLVVCDSTDCSSRERASGTLYTDAFLRNVKALVGETGSFVRNYTSLLWNLDEAAATLPRSVWIPTTGLGGPHQTSELSSSVKSKSIRLIFGRIDRSRRVLEARPKSWVQTVRVRAH